MKKLYFNLGKNTLVSLNPFRLLLMVLLVGYTAFGQIAQRGVATTATTNGSSLSINKPTGVAVGDIMLVNIVQRGNNTLSNPTSAGWILIAGADLVTTITTRRWGTVLYKIATPTDALVTTTAYTFALDVSANGSVGSIVAFSGVDQTTPFDVANGGLSVQASQTGVVATAKTTATANAAVIMFGMAAASGPTWLNANWTTTSPGTLAELYDNQNAGRSSVGAAWAIKPTIGSTGTGGATLSSAERNGGILVILRQGCIPSVAPTGITGTTTICNGQSTTLGVSGGSAGTGAIAEWFIDSCGGTPIGTGNSINVSPTSNTTYYVRYAGACNTTTCASVTVIVENPVSAAGIISGTSIVCQGNTGINYSVPSIVNATGYDWTLPSGASITAGANTNSITVSFSTTASSGNITVSGKNSCGNGVLSSFPVTVNPLMGVTGTIDGITPVCQGQNGVAYSIPAIANATDYNWVLPAGATIASGLNTNSITVDFASNAVSGDITVQGSNSCGFGTIASFPVTVNQAIGITTQPTVSQTLCATGSVSFSVVATGGGLSYQWYKGTTALNNGGSISGANSATLTINPTVTGDSGADYNCVVSNNCGSINSNNAALTVNEMPVIPNQNLSICSDNAFSFIPTNGVPTAATIVPAGTTYSWSAPVVTGGMTGGATGSNQTIISGTLINPSTSDQTATYTVTPKSGTTGFCIGNPFTVVVTVKPSPSISNINATVCSGEALTVTPVAGGGNIVPPGTTYSWGLPSVSGGITGATAASGQSSFGQTLVNPTNTSQVATYIVTASYGGCIDNTFSIFVTVNPKPTSAGSVITQSICSGLSIAPIMISNPNGVPGTITYSWTRDNTTNVTGIPNGSGSTVTGNLTNTTNTQQTTIFSLYASSSNGCISLPTNVTVAVDPVPSVAATPTSQTICSGDGIGTINISNPNNVVGTTFNWSRDNTTNITGIPPGDTTASITGNLTNITNVPQTTTFTVVAVNNTCNSPTTSVSVTVNPKPTVAVSVASQTVCGGLPFANITISNPNNVSGTTFSWTRVNTTNLTGVANSGSGNIISGTLINNTNSIQTETFTITATASGCPSTSITATVTVNPTPLLAITPAGPVSVCNAGTMPTFALSNSNNVVGTTYSWTRDKTAEITGVAANGSGNIPASTLTNTTTATQTMTFTVTATAPNGCFSTKIVSVTVYAPLVTPVISSSQDVCTGQTPTGFSMTTPVLGGSGSYTYQWQRSARNSGGPWANVGTAQTYNPSANEYDYRLIVTDSFCTSNTVTSNIIYINVLGVGGVLDAPSVTNAPTSPVCNGAIPPITVDITHTALSAVKFNWSSNNSYVTPASGGPVGTTSGGFFPTTSYVFNFTAANTTNATVSTTITVVPSFTNGLGTCNSTSTTINLQIRPTPVVTATVPNTTICSGSSGGIAVKGNITDATMTFSWTRDNSANVSGSASGTSGAIAAGGTFTIPDALTNISASSQNVNYTITPSSNGCSGTPITVTITVAPPLTPGTVVASQTICSGGDPNAFTETVAAIGSGISYQWQSSTSSATGPWTNIPSATAVGYDVPSGLTQTTWYQRVVTSTLNGVTCAVASAVPIQVTINTITPGSVAGNQTICSSGDPAAFTSVAATGGGAITYQWQSNTTGCGGSWSDIGGATSATYDVPAGLLVTTYYRRIAISTLNGNACSDYSNCITVSVNNVTAGTISGDQTTCGTTPVAFTESVAATGTGVLSYQWQSNTTGCGGAWSDISGATGVTYSPPGLSGTTYYHRVTISTLNGVSCSAIGNCITVTVNSIMPGAIASNRTVCSGGDPAVFTETTAATGTALTYQWQMSTDSGLGPWSSINLATNSTYDAPSLTQTTYYQRVAYSTVNGLTCSAASNSVTVFVNDVTAPVIAGSQSVCGSADPAAFTVSTAATGLGTLSYQWQSNTTGCGGTWSPISGATSATYDAGPVTQTTYYQVVVTSTLNAVQCTAISNCVVVTYNPNLPVSVNISASANSICSGTPVTFTAVPTNGGTTPSYQWKLNGGDVGTNSNTYTNAALANNDSVTCVMISNAVCAIGNPATSTPVVMIVNTVPAAPALNNIVLTCGQITTTETWTAIPNSTEYRFDLSLDSSFATFMTGYQDLSVGLSPSPSVTVSGLNPGTTYYVRVRAQNSCGPSANSATATITVGSLPSTPIAAATSQPTCAVSTGTITVTAPTGAGLSYSIDSSVYTNITGVFSNVPVGSYTITVKDGLGCVSLGSTPVAINAIVTNIWDGTKWSKTGDTTPPTINDKVVFNANFNIITQLNACSCQIKTGVDVTVGVPVLDPSYLPGKNANAILKIENELDVQAGGSLTFENNASLIQVNNVSNTGKIRYRRITTPMKNFDYTYWSSPVKDQVLNVLSPNTLSDKYFSFANDDWVYENGTSTMNPAGKGFIIRVPKPDTHYPNGEYWTGATYSQPVLFEGVPYNGDITIAAQGVGKSNLIGNPYPSAIDADSFITANASVIDGALNFWTHNTVITQSGSFYVYNSNDYATYTLTGGTGTGAAPTGGAIPEGKIAAGQSFFVTSNNTNNFVFNNGMRNTAKVLPPGSNSQFFRIAQTKKTETIEKNRVWLNLTNSGGAFKQLLVGYITGATNETDNLYDGISLDGNTYIDFYSINNGKNLSVQGRALPFENTDEVPLGYRTTIEGVFTISIDKTDGLLADQDIFIKDKIKGTVVNLKKEPYTFSTAIGVFNDRFVLQFSNNDVVVSPVNATASDKKSNSAIVSVKNKQIKVNSFDGIIDKIMVYDLKGSLLYEKANVNNSEFVISDFNSGNQFLIVQIVLKNGKWITQETVF